MNRYSISFICITTLIIVILVYSLFEARKILTGPDIHIDSPKDDTATSSSIITISGEAHNIAFLDINDAPAYTDLSGHFSEAISPPPGYSVVTVSARDQFGRRVSESVHITVLSYCPVNL